MRCVKFGNMIKEVVPSPGVNQIIAQGCNAQGSMNSGVAKVIRDRWPGVYKPYQQLINSGPAESLLGQVATYETESGLIILNAITQLHFGKDGKKYVSYEAVHKSFTIVAELAEAINAEVNYPLIGAGLGGGDWSIISDIIDAAFDSYPNIKRTLWILE